MLPTWCLLHNKIQTNIFNVIACNFYNSFHNKKVQCTNCKVENTKNKKQEIPFFAILEDLIFSGDEEQINEGVARQNITRSRKTYGNMNQFWLHKCIEFKERFRMPSYRLELLLTTIRKPKEKSAQKAVLFQQNKHCIGISTFTVDRCVKHMMNAGNT